MKAVSEKIVPFASRVLLSHRKPVLIAAALLLVVSAALCTGVRISMDQYIGSARSLAGIEIVPEVFPDTYIAVGIETDDPFSEAARSEVSRVVSLLEERSEWWIVQAPDVTDSGSAVESLLSPDRRSWAVLLKLTAPEEEDSWYEYLRAFRRENPGVHVSGFPFLTKLIHRTIRSEFYLLFLAGVLVLYAMYLLLFRSFGEALRLWLVSIGPALVTGAAFPVMGRSITVFTMIAPICAAAISTSYGIHARRGLEETGGDLSSFYETRGKVLFLDAITTILGFATLLVTRYPEMRTLGLVSILGVAVALLFGLAVYPLLEATVSRARQIRPIASTAGETQPRRVSVPAIGRGRAVAVVLFLVPVLTAVSGLDDTGIQAIPGQVLSLRTSAGLDVRFLEERYGSFSEFSLTFDSGSTYGLVNKDLFDRFLTFRSYLKLDPLVVSVYDFTDAVRGTLDRLPGNSAEVRSDEEIGEALELFSGSLLGDELDRLVDSEYRFATFHVRTRPGIDAREVAAALESWKAAAVESGLQPPVSCNGDIVITTALNLSVVPSQRYGVYAFFALVFLFLWYRTRSWAKALCICIPPIVGTAAALGLTGLLGWKISVGHSLAVAIIAGVGIDDALMYMIAPGSNRNLSRPIIETTAVLVGIIAVLFISTFVTIHYIAAIAITGLVVSTATVLIVLPLTDPIFRKEKTS